MCSSDLDKTTWNGIDILAATASYGLQIGAADGATLSFQIDDLAGGTDVAAVIGMSADDADAISAIDDAITEVNTSRSTLGAIINRLQFSIDSMTNVSTNTAASRSRIEDTDYANATSELAKRQIIQQAATAMLAQANQRQANVLSLLQ